MGDSLLSRYCITSVDDIKKFDLTTKPFEPIENEKGPKDQTSEEATAEQQRITSKISSSAKEKQISNQWITPLQKKTSTLRKKENPNSVKRQNRYEVLRESNEDEKKIKNTIEENVKKTTPVANESNNQ